jgi:hypothetical protein
LWSFSEWIESKDLIFQANFAMLFRASPYFIGYYILIFSYMANRPDYALMTQGEM